MKNISIDDNKIIEIFDYLDNNLIAYISNLEYDKIVYILNQNNDLIYFFNRNFDDPFNKKMSMELKYILKLISPDEWNKIRIKIKKKSYNNILKINKK